MQCMGSSSSQEKKAHRPNKERFLCIESEEKTSSEQTQTFDSDYMTSCYVSHMDFFHTGQGNFHKNTWSILRNILWGTVCEQGHMSFI